MIERRRAALEAGEHHVGWKLAFGAPSALARFDLSGPVVGYLTDATVHPTGSSISCAGWVRPVAEPELAVRFGSHVVRPENAPDEVASLELAIELANVDPPPEDIDDVMAGNIYHRAVLFGETRTPIDDLDVSDLGLSVTHSNHRPVEVEEPEELTGRISEVLVHAAGLLGAVGESFRAGDVVILGSVTPPLEIAPGDEIAFASAVLEPVEVEV